MTAARSIGVETWSHLDAGDDDVTLIWERPKFLGLTVPPHDARKPLPSRGHVAGNSDLTQPARRRR